MSTIIPSEDDATQHYDNSDDESKNADRCGCDDCRSDLLRPHAIAIPYKRSFRRAFVPRARTGGLSGIALMKAIQESLQESYEAHRVANEGAHRSGRSRDIRSSHGRNITPSSSIFSPRLQHICPYDVCEGAHRSGRSRDIMSSQGRNITPSSSIFSTRLQHICP
jgi:hypothetical protein